MYIKPKTILDGGGGGGSAGLLERDIENCERKTEGKKKKYFTR
jgi:hypothetical protein